MVTIEGLQRRRRAVAAPDRLPQASRAAMRLLHAGDPHHRARAAERGARRRRGPRPRGAVGQSLPLYRLYPDHRGGARGARRLPEAAMTRATAISAARSSGSRICAFCAAGHLRRRSRRATGCCTRRSSAAPSRMAASARSTRRRRWRCRASSRDHRRRFRRSGSDHPLAPHSVAGDRSRSSSR